MRTPYNPKDPCSYMVYTWALKGILYRYLGVYVDTRICANQKVLDIAPPSMVLLLGPKPVMALYLDPLG